MLSLTRRVPLLFAGPFLAATWHCDTWVMSKHIAEKMTTWVRYKLGHVIGIHMEGNTDRDVNNW